MTVKKTKKRVIARVTCKGTLCNATNKSVIEGVTDCKVAHEMIGSESEDCTYGCLGYGTCVEECPFDAIELIDGIAHVIEAKCKSCRKCVRVCPREVIAMIPLGQEVVVDCNSHDAGKAVKDKCKVGCISCQLCVKACPFFAMDFTDKLATINYDNCTNCKICADKCPTKAITAELSPRGVADISEEKCIGCTVCAQICPVAAIEGFRDETHHVKIDMCIGCTVCAKVCPVNAIEMVEKDKSKIAKAKQEQTVTSYQKELVKFYDSFEQIKDLSETIDYSEQYNSEHFKGSLSLEEASRVDFTDGFRVVYRGELSTDN